MNQDVLKSLSYLEKSLKMTRRAISNAVNANPNDQGEYAVVQDMIQDLIDTLENSTIVPKVASVPVSVSVSVAPVVPSPVPPVSNNPIDFLDP